MTPSPFRARWRVALATLAVAASAAASAQPVPVEGVTVYRFLRPGQASVQLRVWGEVRQPGLYEVPPSTDLPSLLSLAGGPETAQPEARVERTVVVEVTRAGGGLVFSAPLDGIAGWRPPPLQDGDIVVVREEVRERFDWRDALSLGTAVTTVLLLIAQVLR